MPSGVLSKDEEELRRRSLVPPPPVTGLAAPPVEAIAPPRPNYPRTDPRHRPPGYTDIYEGARPGGVIADAAKSALSPVSGAVPKTNQAATRAKSALGSATAGFKDANTPADYGRATRDTIGTALLGGVDVASNFAKEITAPGVDPAGRQPRDFLKTAKGFTAGFLGIDSPNQPGLNGADALGNTENAEAVVGPPVPPPAVGPPEPTQGLQDVAMGGPEAIKPTSSSSIAAPQQAPGIEIIRHYPGRGGPTRQLVDPVSGRPMKDADHAQALINKGIAPAQAEELSIDFMKARADLIRAGAIERNSKMAPVTQFKHGNDPVTGLPMIGFQTQDENGDVVFIQPEGLTVPFGEGLIVEAETQAQTSATGEKISTTRPVVMRTVIGKDGQPKLVTVPAEEQNADERLATENYDEFTAIFEEFSEQNPDRDPEEIRLAALQRLRERQKKLRESQDAE